MVCNAHQTHRLSLTTLAFCRRWLRHPIWAHRPISQAWNDWLWNRSWLSQSIWSKWCVTGLRAGLLAVAARWNRIQVICSDWLCLTINEGLFGWQSRRTGRCIKRYSQSCSIPFLIIVCFDRRKQQVLRSFAIWHYRYIQIVNTTLFRSTSSSCSTEILKTMATTACTNCSTMSNAIHLECQSGIVMKYLDDVKTQNKQYKRQIWIMDNHVRQLRAAAQQHETEHQRSAVKY